MLEITKSEYDQYCENWNLRKSGDLSMKLKGARFIVPSGLLEENGCFITELLKDDIPGEFNGTVLKAIVK